MRVLGTGGAGYIGSHTCLELLKGGHDVFVVDNLCNSKRESLSRVAELAGRKPEFARIDVRDEGALAELLRGGGFGAAIHFAGLKAVGESTEMPLAYYDNNVAGTISLCRAMARSGLKNIVFSSSATVYGDPAGVPIPERFPTSATNPYGRSKLFIEQILTDLHRADKDWNVVVLRYFNPVGAHASGRIGEDPNGVPNNLMPFVCQVAAGKRPRLRVFGGDYDTRDGTGVRDYIHVVDLARGHIKALEKLRECPGLLTYNLGTGRGYSVLEMIRAFEHTSGRAVPYDIVERRAGDVAACFADPTSARRELGWTAELDLEDMVRDAWRWQSNNPDGYGDAG
jgi:UDP-glucose 4-epimerase